MQKKLLEGIKVQAVRADSPFGVGRSAARGSGPAPEQAATWWAGNAPARTAAT